MFLIIKTRRRQIRLKNRHKKIHSKKMLIDPSLRKAAQINYKITINMIKKRRKLCWKRKI